MSETVSSKRSAKRIWARTQFDLEGIVGALAAWLVGVLLGWLWSPLFWIGAGLAILILLATRKQTRVSPETTGLVLAPCDGVVHSVERALPPSELRMEGGERVRIRVASAPFSTNPVYAVMTGEIASLIVEEPDSSVILASQADLAGLAVAHITLESTGQTIGCTLATGGFGPRLDMMSEAGDPVRAGRVIGKRRLGGWCDVYLPANMVVSVLTGQTLIGGETVLCQFSDEGADNAVFEAGETASDLLRRAEKVLPAVEAADSEEDKAEVPDEASVEAEEVAAPDTSLEEMGNEAVDQVEKPSETLSETSFDEGGLDDPEEAAAELFKKLKGDSAD